MLVPYALSPRLITRACLGTVWGGSRIHSCCQIRRKGSTLDANIGALKRSTGERGWLESLGPGLSVFPKAAIREAGSDGNFNRH